MYDETFAATRTALQSVGEHILSAARHRATGRIGLEVVVGGIATPAFGDDDTTIGVIDGDLVVRDRHGERRTRPTTLRAAGVFVGVTPGAPALVYRPTTPCILDAPLRIDPATLDRMVKWYELVDAALRQFRNEIKSDASTDLTLWPEHFDVAIRAADVNYGGLAGDGSIPSPYVYVGPPTTALVHSDDPYWNASFGATRTIDDITTVDDAVAFFQEGRSAAARLLSR